jgi:hypothetical protein
MDGCASRPLGPQRSKSHVDGQRLVVVDPDRGPVFVDDACNLCPRGQSPRVLLIERKKFSGQAQTVRRVAVYALGIGSAGHAHAAVESWVKLTFESDHPMGADHTHD